MSEQSSQELLDDLRTRLIRIQHKQAENDVLLSKLDTVRDQLGALAGRATSADGTVTVIAGSGGIVRSVELTDEALRSNARTLSATITTAIQAAIADATTRQLEIVRTHIDPAVEPERILGPQAKFASFAPAADAAEPAAHVKQDDGPVGDSAQFLRKLGLEEY